MSRLVYVKSRGKYLVYIKFSLENEQTNGLPVLFGLSTFGFCHRIEYRDSGACTDKTPQLSVTADLAHTAASLVVFLERRCEPQWATGIFRLMKRDREF